MYFISAPCLLQHRIFYHAVSRTFRPILALGVSCPVSKLSRIKKKKRSQAFEVGFVMYKCFIKMKFSEISDKNEVARPGHHPIANSSMVNAHTYLEHWSYFCPLSPHWRGTCLFSDWWMLSFQVGLEKLYRDFSLLKCPDQLYIICFRLIALIFLGSLP